MNTVTYLTTFISLHIGFHHSTSPAFHHHRFFLFPFYCSPPPLSVRLYGCLVFDHLKQILQVLEAAVYIFPHKLVGVICPFLINPSSANEHFAKVFRISGDNAIWILLEKSAGGDNGCSAIDTGQRVEVPEGGDV